MSSVWRAAIAVRHGVPSGSFSGASRRSSCAVSPPTSDCRVTLSRRTGCPAIFCTTACRAASASRSCSSRRIETSRRRARRGDTLLLRDGLPGVRRAGRRGGAPGNRSRRSCSRTSPAARLPGARPRRAGGRGHGGLGVTGGQLRQAPRGAATRGSDAPDRWDRARSPPAGSWRGSGGRGRCQGRAGAGARGVPGWLASHLSGAPAAVLRRDGRRPGSRGSRLVADLR